MDSVPVGYPEVWIMIKYDGQWVSNTLFSSIHVAGLTLPSNCTYDSLYSRVCAAMGKNYAGKNIKISYVFVTCPPPVNVCDDDGLHFYLQLKSFQKDPMQMPLCVEFFSGEEVDATSGEEQSITGGVDIDNEIVFDHSSEVEERGGCSRGGCDGEDNNFTHSLDMDFEFEHISSADIMRLNSRVDEEIHNMPVLNHFEPTRIALNSIYGSKKELDFHLKMYAITNFFQYRTKTSCPKVLHVGCVDPDCKWAVRGVRIDGVSLFQVKRFDSEHTCPIDVRQRNSRQATSRIIAELVKHEYGDASNKPYPPKSIMLDMKTKYDIYMSYKKAWVAKEMAMELAMGSEKDSYARLPSMCHVLERSNPGSIVSYSCKENGEFINFFMCLSAWREGWINCIPVIIVDESFLKSYYKGTLLTACTQDANKQIFPLAFGICSGENTENWSWFFSMLKHSLMHRDDLYIVSDRHEGIITSVRSVFPHAEHGYCVYHILANLKTRFRGTQKTVSWKFLQAARVGSVYECEEYLQMLDSEDPHIRTYLERMGHHKWSHAYASRNRYSVMMSNNAESLNAVNATAREYPICKLIEFIIARMQKWFCERRESSSSNNCRLSAHFESELAVLQAMAAVMRVKPSCVFEFEVFDKRSHSYVVNLKERTCSCREFQLDGFLCVHAIAAIRSRPGFSCYDYISEFYTAHHWAQTYRDIIHPIGSPDGWMVPSHVKQITCSPPIM
ncbi:unnamed protein product [Cuscuta europaea]|uniref:SWIM-type domain-containing protein n=1 Tax=Cuscuta europaea TaxID=41803 RepID=A0A9P1E7I6_CUSEU|nr:unnamed protein product [Cuscuta europaea]